MKKILIILGLLLFITGCTNVKELNYNELLNLFASKESVSNIYRTGYKYYLPRNMTVKSYSLSNEIISDGKNTYYLYVDFSSYFNTTKDLYEEKQGLVYSKRFTNNQKYGYLEIILIENNKYLVEIMYNYAKIEVIVDKNNSNEAIISAINILNSIEYNDNIIANILGNNVLSFSEEEFDLFKTHSSDNTFIQTGEEETFEEDVIPDTDLIN